VDLTRFMLGLTG